MSKKFFLSNVNSCLTHTFFYPPLPPPHDWSFFHRVSLLNLTSRPHIMYKGIFAIRTDTMKTHTHTFPCNYVVCFHFSNIFIEKKTSFFPKNHARRVIQIWCPTCVFSLVFLRRKYKCFLLLFTLPTPFLLYAFQEVVVHDFHRF